MPPEEYWNSLFDIPKIIEWLKPEDIQYPIVEIGCGYGSFTIPLAEKAKTTVFAFDIEKEMIEITKRNAVSNEIKNITVEMRDVLDQGTGLSENSIGLVLLFNILHFPQRTLILDETYRILKYGGICAIIHWRKDIETPRGPRYEDRPDRETILAAVGNNKLIEFDNVVLEPYHWGMKLMKKGN